MKIFRIITALSVFFALYACEDVLDRKPLDKISEADVWSNKSMIETYVTDLYVRFPFFPISSSNKWLNYSDEATTSTGNTGALTQGTMSRTNDPEKYWDYAYIRDCNVFLEKIGSTPIDDATKMQLEGEVRAIRAYIYYQMMIRYGGVPLVDVVLDPFKPVDSKYTHRATEEAVANFIEKELDTAIGLLTEEPSSKGKINKWTACAMKARACLWAASIAKYGTVQLNGLVGIPAARAEYFYGKASEAAAKVIASGKYGLYEKKADKAENYRELFLDKDNNEVIFTKVYDGVNVYHEFDEYHKPYHFAFRKGGQLNPTLEFLLGFENADGTTDQPVFGKDNLYANGWEPFKKKDVRLKSSVFFQGDEFQGDVVATYEGLDPSPTPDPAQILSNPAVKYNGIPVVGADSRKILMENQATKSGFLIKKYIDPNNIKNIYSSTNWILFRLAEMYLVVAEAEMELGNKKPAADALNMTRKRAGITLVDETTVTIDKVRLERRSELGLETHRFWDLRRWRASIDVLNGKRFQGLQIIWHYASGKYYFLPMNCETFTRSFKAEHYYNPITNERINNNPDLEENPNY